MKNINVRICVIVFVVFIILCILLKIQTEYLGGDAVSGYKTTDKYLIRGDEDYQEVLALEWYLNYILTVIMVVFALLFGISFNYLMWRYAYPVVSTN